MSRIFSRALPIFSRQLLFLVPASLLISTVSTPAVAQQATNQDFYTDPATGIVYRKVTRTVERPISETKVETQSQTFYRPETITETKPSMRTVYVPVVENNWETRIHGRWNPFQQPTVAYHQVPKTRWEPRSETIQNTQVRTQWVAENRSVEVPRQIVRMEREQKVDFEPIGRVAPPTASHPNSDIAARLRPLDANQRIEPIGGPMTAAPVTSIASTYTAPRIAAGTVGRMTSDPTQRSLSQIGLRAQELLPSTGTPQSQAFTPSIATEIAMPRVPMFR
jgi:hypothetical protein